MPDVPSQPVILIKAIAALAAIVAVANSIAFVANSGHLDTVGVAMYTGAATTALIAWIAVFTGLVEV